jgi:type I restriction enzyme, S subunit
MSINIPDGYKKTEIGIIPKEWDVKHLEEISEKIMVGIASAATHAYSVRGIVLFRNQNIKNGYLDDRDILYIKEEYEELFKNKRLKAGDLIIARTGYPGTACVIPDKYEGTQSFTTLITRPKKQSIRSDFLCYFINSEVGHSFFETSQIGGGQKNVNAGSLKFMPIPVPSPPEQKAIAQSLSDVDALITECDRMIAKKRNTKQGTMQQLLTGQKRLPGFSGEWELKTFKDISFVNQGLQIAIQKRLKQPVSNSKKYITIQFLNNGKDTEYINDYSSSVCCDEDDVLMTRTGNTGIVVSGVNGVFHNNFFKINFDRKILDKNYLIGYLNLDKTQKLILTKAGTSTIPELNHNDFYSITIPIPSISEQKAIAQILSDMDAEIAALEQKRDKYKAIKQGMMQELLTRKTRLISSS